LKHINTVSKAEKSMRQLYKVAGDKTPIVAEKRHLDMIARILECNRQADVLKAEMSELIGSLMGYMQVHESLVDDKGKTLVTWKNGSEKVSVDYDALILELNVPPATLARHTTRTPGSRVFTVED